MSRLLTALRRRASDERGLTIIEVVIAMLVFVIGAVAILTVVDAATRNSLRAQQQQAAVNVAQRELEAMRNLTYSQVAMTSTPTVQASSLDPRNRVSGSSFNLNRTGTSNYAAMVVSASGSITPGPTSFTAGDVSGKIYRWVVWQDDPNISGTQNSKRLIVDVTINTTGETVAAHPYLEYQSDFADTRTGPGTNNAPASPSTGSTKNVSMFLTDTPVLTTGSPCDPNHVTPTAHATHNTTGALGGGGCPASNPPDYMSGSLQATVNDAPDYATGLTQGSTSGAGIHMNTQSGTCSSGAASTSIHRWISPPLNLTLSNESTLTLWTRQPTGTASAGKICIFTQSTGLLSLAVPLSATVTGLPGGSCALDGTLSGLPPSLTPNQFVCSSTAWPTSWTKIQIDMKYVANIGALSAARVVLAIGVGNQAASPNGIQIGYDSVNQPSRLDLCLNVAGTCLV